MTFAELLKIRSCGQRPADMVILSLCGRLRMENPVILIPETSQLQDMRGLADLNVQIAHAGRSLMRVVHLADAILRAMRVRSLSTWNIPGDQVVLIEENGMRVMREVP